MREGTVWIDELLGKPGDVVRVLLGRVSDPLYSVIPLVAAVELGNGYEPVEEPIADPDGPVDNDGMMPESELVLETPRDSDVELPMLAVAEPEGVVMDAVEELSPRVRLPLALTEVNSSEEIESVVGDDSEPVLLLGKPVGPMVTSVELVIENGGLLNVGKLDDELSDVPNTLDVSVEDKLPIVVVPE